MEADTERWLRYREKHAGLQVFGCVYWAVYSFVVGFMLLAASYSGVSLVRISGVSAILLAVFLVIYGLVVYMHHKLMKRHG